MPSGILPRWVPIRWRLAGGSSVLTLAILVCFAAGMGKILTDRLNGDFERQTSDAARTLAANLAVTAGPTGYRVGGIAIDDFAASQRAHIRILDLSGNVIDETIGAPDFGLLPVGAAHVGGYRVQSAEVPVLPAGRAVVEYARSSADLERTVGRVWLLLAIGVIGGALLALVFGLAVARRGLRPVTDLTRAARDIERTSDAGREIPIPDADDEVRVLAQTLRSMLASLDRAQADTARALERQTRFVADASHELRTPLTAVIANLEMVDGTEGADDLEAAAAALRSALRMEALVGDLLLLARGDAEIGSVREELDLAELTVQSVDELRVLATGRRLGVDVCPAIVTGDSEAIRRAVRNLVANALTHTPDGVPIDVTLRIEGDRALLEVDDGGPGIPADQRSTIFQRFVRGGGDAGAGTGLGLAIVDAVASAHGGAIEVGESPLGGARFTLTLPLAQA